MQTMDLLEQIEHRFSKMTTDEIKQFINDAKARAVSARRANSKHARKIETQRLVLNGRLLHHIINAGILSQEAVDAERDKFLTRNADRALFDLVPLPEETQPKRRLGRGRQKSEEVIEPQFKAIDAPENVNGDALTASDPAPPPVAVAGELFDDGVWLNVSRDEKEAAKALGVRAVWNDSKFVGWYMPTDFLNDENEGWKQFLAWLPEGWQPPKRAA